MFNHLLPLFLQEKCPIEQCCNGAFIYSTDFNILNITHKRYFVNINKPLIFIKD